MKRYQLQTSDGLTVGQLITATIPVIENGAVIWKQVRGFIREIEQRRRYKVITLTNGTRFTDDYVKQSSARQLNERLQRVKETQKVFEVTA